MPLYKKKPPHCSHRWIQEDCHSPAYFKKGAHCSRCGIAYKWYRGGRTGKYVSLWVDEGAKPHYCECKFNPTYSGQECCPGKKPFPTDDREEE